MIERINSDITTKDRELIKKNEYWFSEKNEKSVIRIKKLVETGLFIDEKLKRNNKNVSPQLKKNNQNKTSKIDVVFEILKYFWDDKFNFKTKKKNLNELKVLKLFKVYEEKRPFLIEKLTKNISVSI